MSRPAPVTKRLQVLFDEDEFKDLQRVARAHKVTVAEWVRQALREARQRVPMTDASRKLDIVRAAAAYEYQTADIATMLAEIERGYSTGES